MRYSFDLNNRAFKAIKNRTKRIEIRATKLGDNHFDYGILKCNDEIEFTSFDGDKIICTIEEVNHYKTVEELLTMEGTRYTLSSTNDFNEGVKSINSLDGYKEAIPVNGIYAIHLEKINNVHEMKLQLKYYNFMLNGTKRIELRLFDEKRQQIKLGDTIKFLKENDLNDSFNTRVIGLLRYDSFDALIKDFDISILCDETMTKDELIGVLEQFYTKEKQEQYGVLGIRIELI